MPFSSPIESSEALSFLESKLVLPTDMKTWALNKLPAELRARLSFSAGVTKAEFIDEAFRNIKALVAGNADRASMRLELKRVLAGLDYRPKDGDVGTIKDLRTDERLNLILDTNTAQAQGYSYFKASQDPVILDAYPAQEFLRVESRNQPRSTWKARWDEARNSTSAEGATNAGSGRMVALKNHPIWAALSRFGTPFEPFDFNSGMGVEDVSREDAMSLGIIDEKTQVQPDDSDFNKTLEANPAISNPQLRKALEATGIGSFDSNGVFKYRKGNG